MSNVLERATFFELLEKWRTRRTNNTFSVVKINEKARVAAPGVAKSIQEAESRVVAETRVVESRVASESS